MGNRNVTDSADLAVTAVKAAPPVAYFSGTTFMGFEINHLIGWMMLIYTALILLDKAFPQWRRALCGLAVKGWRKCLG
jgi:hypothetical protein